MSDRFSYPQALSPEEFRRLGSQVIEIAARHLETVVELPIRPVPPEEVKQQLLEQPLPLEGRSPADMLAFLEQNLMPYARGNGHPGYMGWVISPPAHMAILTDLLGAAIDTNCGGGHPAATWLERCAIRWIKALLGYESPDSHGLLVSGGSMANLNAIAAARYAAARRADWDIREQGMCGGPDLVLYASRETHSCVTKAVELMGMGQRAIRFLDTDEQYRIDLDALESAVAEDFRDGRVPFCIVGNAGTANTGAVDNLAALADICEKHDIWLHVDGSYGAFGVMDPRRADLFAGMDRADSIALDPHKWLSTPFDCGCVLVRDRHILRDCFSLMSPLIRQVGMDTDDLGAQHEYGLELSRSFRALKVWSVLSHVGVEGFRDTISRQNTMAADLADYVEQSDDLELLAPPVLSVVCFRYVPPDLDADEERLNALNKDIVVKLQAEGRVYPSSTELEGRFTIRANIFHYAADRSDVDTLIEDVRRYGGELMQGSTP